MFKKIALAAALTLMASSSFAAPVPSYYAGVDAGSTKIDGYSDRETSYGAFFGYQFHTNFAIEGGYRRLADFDVIGANVTADQTALSVIGSLPVGNGFSVYGRLGYNRVDVKATTNGVSAKDKTNGGLYGIGASYAFSPVITGRVEFQRPSSDSTNLSAGVAFSF